MGNKCDRNFALSSSAITFKDFFRLDADSTDWPHCKKTLTYLNVDKYISHKKSQISTTSLFKRECTCTGQDQQINSTVFDK